MALNKYMHPRNIYKKKKANFQVLAIKYPEFRKHVFPDVSGKLFLDFSNPESLRQLSITLMKDDFGLDVELPPDRLVPTIPLRLNYILWIDDILKDSGTSGTVSGIDLGTGGSCVYPLLSTSMFKWKFLATEVDDTNFEHAVKNVNKNNFTDYITVKKVDESCILVDAIKETTDTYDFCMCNPPFFSDHLEAQGITNSRSDDRPEPHSVNTASPTESVAFGGEVEFVKRMMHESMELKDRVRVFTSMVGKKSSLVPLKEELKKLKITNFSTTDFCQGKTMRWGIGWSFDEKVKFPKSQFKEKKKEKRPPLSYVVPEDSPNLMYTIEGVAYQLKQLLKELQIRYVDKKSSDTKISMEITAKQNTWSNQRRKRRQEQFEKKGGDINQNNSKTAKLESGNPGTVTEHSDFKVDETAKIGREHSDKDIKLLYFKAVATTKRGIEDPGKVTKETDFRIEGNLEKCNKPSDKRKRKYSGESDRETKDVKMAKLDGNTDVDNENDDNSNTQSCRLTHKKVLENDLESTHQKIKVEPMDYSERNSEYDVKAENDRVDCHIKTEARTSSSEPSPGIPQVDKTQPSKPGSSGETSSAPQEKTDDVKDTCVLNCNLIVKLVEDEQVLIAMARQDGQYRESMNQVLQYFKNKLKQEVCNNKNVC